jgi:hypothetical protein
MAKSITETEPQFTPNTIVFRGTLEALRRELESKKTKWEVADDMFLELEKTINNALRERDRDEEIEFTENEWKQLITRENLPPVDVLTRKIEKMRKVTEEAKIEQGALLEDIKDEWKKLVKKAGTAIGITPEKLDAFRQKAEKIKNLSGPIAWTAGVTMSIGLFFKILGLRFKNWVSGLTGKKWKYDKEIELAEIEKAWIEDPVAAAKTYTGEALAQVKEKVEKKEGAKEWDEWVTEKSDSWMLCKAVIWSTLLWGFMSKIPESLRSKIGPISGKSFLAQCAKNRALRMFGVPGFLLSGVAILSIFIEKPEVQEKLGPIPEGWEAQKNYFEDAITLCDNIGDDMRGMLRNILVGAWSALNGSTLDTYLDAHEKEVPEGMVTLEEKMEPVIEYIDDLEFEIEKQWDKIKDLVITGAIIIPGMKNVILTSGKNWLQLACAVSGLIGKNLMATLFILSAIRNGAVLAGHTIHVPKNDDELEGWMRDIVTLPEIRNEFEKQGLPTETLDQAAENMGEVVDILSDEEQRDTRLRAEQTKVMEKLSWVGISFFAPEKKEVLLQKNREWITWFRKSLNRYLKDPGEREKIFIRRIQELEKKWHVEKSDITDIMTASHDTRVTLHDKWNGYIRWSIKNEGGIVEASDFLCVNPLLDQNEQYHKARKMPLNREGTGGMLGVVPSAFLWGLQKELTELRDAVEKNDTRKWGELLKKMMGAKWEVVVIWSQVIWEWVTLPLHFYQNIIKTWQGEMTSEELLVETVDGIAPIVVLTSGYAVWSNVLHRISHGRLGKKLGILRVLWTTASILIGKWQLWDTPRSMYRMLKNTRNTGEVLCSMIDDGKFIIQSWFYEFIERNRSLRYNMGGSLFNKSMKELAKIAIELADMQKVGRTLELAKRAKKESRIKEMDDLIDKAKKQTEEIIKKHEWKYGKDTPHPLRNVANVSNTNIEEIIDTLDHDGQKLYDRRTLIHTETWKTVRQRAQEINKLPENSPTKKRLRKTKWIAGFITLLVVPVTTSIVAEKLTHRDAANEDDELGESYQEVEYWDFAPDEAHKSTTVDDHAPEMAPIFKEVDVIKDTLIGEEDPEKSQMLLTNNLNFFLNTNEKEVRQLLTTIEPRYQKSIEQLRNFAKKHRETLLRYFRENPEKQKKEIKVCEFLGITFNKWELEMRYMSREKFERHFFTTFDHVTDNKKQFADGNQSLLEKTREIGANMIPISSSWIDTRQAWRDISRWHIRSWIINGTMATVWWISDVLIIAGLASAVISGPVWPMLWVGWWSALKGSLTAVRWSKYVAKFVKSEHILESASLTAHGVYLAIEKDKIEKL